jgi:hypothetical protein
MSAGVQIRQARNACYAGLEDAQTGETGEVFARHDFAGHFFPPRQGPPAPGTVPEQA